jgi:hypothetical protein
MVAAFTHVTSAPVFILNPARLLPARAGDAGNAEDTLAPANGAATTL